MKFNMLMLIHVLNEFSSSVEARPPFAVMPGSRECMLFISPHFQNLLNELFSGIRGQIDLKGLRTMQRLSCDIRWAVWAGLSHRQFPLGGEK